MYKQSDQWWWLGTVLSSAYDSEVRASIYKREFEGRVKVLPVTEARLHFLQVFSYLQEDTMKAVFAPHRKIEE